VIKTAHKRKADRRARHHIEVAQEIGLLHELQRRGWDALVAAITAFVLEGTPANDADLAAEHARTDAWFRAWLTARPPRQTHLPDTHT
jgi:hypothetical protein